MSNIDRSTKGGKEIQIGPLGQFAIKTAIVCGAVIISLLVLTNYIDDLIESKLQQYGSIGGRQFWSKVERAMDEQADPKNDLSPEKKQKIIAAVRAVSDKWRPFYFQLRDAVEGQSGGASKP
jgi:hypothetical protein